MIAALADLQDDSNAFMSLATAADEDAVAALHADNDEGLLPATRRFRNRFKGLLETFQSSLVPYKDPNEMFINVRNDASILVDARSWEEVAEQDRTSEALFQLANVTQLLNLTLQSRSASNLDYINLHFPTPFFTDFVTSWGSALSEATIEIALSIRTQYLIDMLYKTMDQPGFDPAYTLRSIFFNDEDGGILALELTNEEGNLPKACQPMFEHRVEQIRQHFSIEEPFVNLATLEASCSWPAFRAELVQWASIRANGLNMQISNRGGIKALQIHLQGGPPALPISEKKRKSVGDKSRQVAELLAKAEENKVRRETPLAQREVALLGKMVVDEIQESPIQTGGYAPATEDVQVDDGPLLASQNSMQVLQTIRLHEAVSNKENVPAGRKGKFIDRQAGAQRIEAFDESQFLNGTPGPSRKRGRMADDEDDASSIQFEDDSRPQESKRARNNMPGDELGDAAMQVAANAQLLAAAASSQPLPTRQTLTPRQNQEPPPSTAPAMVEGIANIPVARAKGGPQQRVPFSLEENARLMELIETLPDGTGRISWAQLEQQDLKHPEGPLLQNRGQVGLKDKARNLKMDFLK